MTSLASWLSPSVMHSLGWTLLHFLWQGTALAALAAVLMSLCRQASSRYAVAVVVLVLMLVAPVATFFSLLPSDETPSTTNAMVAKQAPAKASAGVMVAASARLNLAPRVPNSRPTKLMPTMTPGQPKFQYNSPRCDGDMYVRSPSVT